MQALLRFSLVLMCFFTYSPVGWCQWLTDYPPEAREWFAPAAAKVEQKAASFEQLGKGKARNIILFVGDGMGVSTITAARIFAGQQQGLKGEEYELAFDRFPFSGMARTYNTNMQTPDSAGTMTALITGVKTKAGILSVSDRALRGVCSTQSGNELFSALELAEIAGKSTGVVSTARITHATPAATYASAVERGWESDKSIPALEKSLGCDDIASQLINFNSLLIRSLQTKAGTKKLSAKILNSIDGPEVILGGGLSQFLPLGRQSLANGLPVKGKRTDGRNLVAEWQLLNPRGQFVHTQEELNQAAKDSPESLLGLFSHSHMAYEAERLQGREKNEASGLQPSLVDMTKTAIDLLSQNEKGFFLVVEAGRIDHAHHAGNAFNALSDTVAFSDAVAAAVNKTDASETLIIVTADHSHVFTMAGYPQRGNPILGKVKGVNAVGLATNQYSLDAMSLPYTTLGYMNGRGMSLVSGNADADSGYDQPINAGRHNVSDLNTEDVGYHQEALVAMEAETHGGEDVAIYAQGPGAYLLSGSHEQNVVFHVINYAGSLTALAEKALLAQP